MKKLMVTFDMGVNGLATFDLGMVGAVLRPNRFSPQNQAAMIILGNGTQLQVPVEVAEDLLKKIDELSTPVDAKPVGDFRSN